MKTPKLKKDSPLERLWNGLIRENPTFVLMLGMCPTLAVTTGAINGLGMGLSTAAVLILALSAVYIWRPSALAGTFPLFAVSLSPFAQFEYMALYGLFDIRAIAVFLSYVVLFVFLTVQKADRKRYL